MIFTHLPAVLVVCTAFLVQARGAIAQEREPPWGESASRGAARGIESHDGFYLRMNLGYVWQRNTLDIAGGPLRVAGSGASFCLAVGGAITRNLILFGEYIDSEAVDPTFDVAGASGTSNGTAGIMALGPGVAYYLEPLNVYVTATVALSKFEASGDAKAANYTSNVGFAAETLVGKEWWVSENWGLGVAGQFIFATAKDNRIQGATWTTLGGGLLFSATYN